MKHILSQIILWLTLSTLISTHAKNIYFINATPFSIILDADYIKTPSFDPCSATVTDRTVFQGQIIKQETAKNCFVSFIEATLLMPHGKDIDIKKGNFCPINQHVFVIDKNQKDTHYQIRALHNKDILYLINATNFPLEFVVEYHNCTNDEGNLPKSHTKELNKNSCHIKKVYGIVDMGHGHHKKTVELKNITHDKNIFVFKRVPKTQDQFKVVGISNK